MSLGSSGRVPSYRKGPTGMASRPLASVRPSFLAFLVLSPWSCPLRAIAGTERQEPQSGLNEPADEGTVSPFAEEPCIEEVLHGGTTVLCIKIPQPLDLRPSET